VADGGECKGCELKARCVRGKNGKRRFLNVPVGRVPGNLTEAMAAKVDSEKGRKTYPRRLAVVDPVFQWTLCPILFESDLRQQTCLEDLTISWIPSLVPNPFNSMRGRFQQAWVTFC
jgi:hypothetical protein